jgi:hypothetical protein
MIPTETEIEFTIKNTSSPKKRLEYLDAFKQRVKGNTNPLKPELNPKENALIWWIEKKIKAEKENLQSQLSSKENLDSNSKTSQNTNDETGSLRPVDWNSIYSRMDELSNEGHSASRASEIVEEEINGVRKAGTIRNKYKGYL